MPKLIDGSKDISKAESSNGTDFRIWWNRKFGKPIPIDDLKHIAEIHLLSNLSISGYTCDSATGAQHHSRPDGVVPLGPLIASLDRVGRGVLGATDSLHDWLSAFAAIAEPFSSLASGLAHGVDLTPWETQDKNAEEGQ